MLEWLADNDVVPSGYSAAKDWITVSLNVSTVERLLDTTYHTYQHSDGGSVFRTPQWSLPAHLHEHIDTVQPTTSFFRAHVNGFSHIVEDAASGHPLEATAHESNAPDNLKSVCNADSVTPSCFETLYKTKGYKVKAGGKNRIGFANYLQEHPITNDLRLFLAKFRPFAVDVASKLKQLVIAGGPGDGPLTPEDLENARCKEANLDVQAIAGINWDTPITSYSTGGR